MNRTVLVIEDNEQNRYLVTFLLEKKRLHRGVRVGRPAGAGTACGHWCRHHPARHPAARDGWLCGRARAAVRAGARDHTHCRRDVVCDVRRPRKALAAGCDGYLEKPIDPDSFVSDIERFLTTSRSASSSRI